MSRRGNVERCCRTAMRDWLDKIFRLRIFFLNDFVFLETAKEIIFEQPGLSVYLSKTAQLIYESLKYELLLNNSTLITSIKSMKPFIFSLNHESIKLPVNDKMRISHNITSFMKSPLRL